MHKTITIGFTLALYFTTASVSGRQLISDGDITVSISDSWSCSESAPIEIYSPKQSFYDLKFVRLQKLLGGVRIALGFECDKINTFNVTGKSESNIIYQGKSSKDANWLLETTSSPLYDAREELNKLPLSFDSLISIDNKIDQLEAEGYANTEPFIKHLTEAQNISEKIVTENLETYSKFINEKMLDSQNLSDSKSYIDRLLIAVKRLSPDKYDLYKATFDERYNYLQENYWNTLINQLTEVESFEIDSVLKGADTLISREDIADNQVIEIDQHLTGYFDHMGESLRTIINQDPGVLEDISTANQHLTSLGNADVSDKLPETANSIATITADLKHEVQVAVEDAKESAKSMIAESGASYLDADSILETGTSVSELFTELGFIEAGQELLEYSFSHLDAVLQSDLVIYKQQLTDSKSTPEFITDLKSEAELFKELSQDIDGFYPFYEAALIKITESEEAVCRNIAANASIDVPDNLDVLVEPNTLVSIPSFSCKLYRNGFVMNSLKKIGNSEIYELIVQNNEGISLVYQLVETFKSSANRYLVGVSLLQSDKKITLNEFDWLAHVKELTELPPSGEPDQNGLTECDLLAGDPDDPNKRADGLLYTETPDPEKYHRAVQACVAAIEYAPEDTTNKYQYARLLIEGGNKEDATPFIESLHNENYSAATFYKAVLNMDKAKTHNEQIDAFELLKVASSGGYKPATEKVTEIEQSGARLYRDIAQPTESEVAQAVAKKANSCQSALGTQLCMRVVGATIHECRQDSANKFTCIFTPSISCKTNLGGAYNNIMGSACRDTQRGLGEFIKRGEGDWEWRQVN